MTDKKITKTFFMKQKIEDQTLAGQALFSKSNWIKLNPKMIRELSSEAAILFSFMVNTEHYLLQRYYKKLKQNEFFFIFNNDWIGKNTGYSKHQIKNALELLEDNQFIVSKRSNFRNQRIIQIQWNNVVEIFKSWYKKEIVNQEFDQGNKELDDVISEDFID
jgi:hypothetical protein